MANVWHSLGKGEGCGIEEGAGEMSNRMCAGGRRWDASETVART